MYTGYEIIFIGEDQTKKQAYEGAARLAHITHYGYSLQICMRITRPWVNSTTAIMYK